MAGVKTNLVWVPEQRRRIDGIYHETIPWSLRLLLTGNPHDAEVFLSKAQNTSRAVLVLEELRFDPKYAKICQQLPIIRNQVFRDIMIIMRQSHYKLNDKILMLADKLHGAKNRRGTSLPVENGFNKARDTELRASRNTQVGDDTISFSFMKNIS